MDHEPLPAIEPANEVPPAPQPVPVPEHEPDPELRLDMLQAVFDDSAAC